MTRLFIVIGFVVWFVAGLAVGWRVGSQPSGPPGPGPRDRGGWLAQQLNLTADQQKQMDAIWSQLAGSGRGGPSGREQRMQLRRQRDEAIAALVPESDKAAYQKINDDYTAAVAAMEKQWRDSFTQAVAKTRAILTADQQKKYDELMSRARRDWDARGDHGRPPHAPPPDDPQSPESSKSPIPNPPSDNGGARP